MRHRIRCKIVLIRHDGAQDEWLNDFVCWIFSDIEDICNKVSVLAYSLLYHVEQCLKRYVNIAISSLQVCIYTECDRKYEKELHQERRNLKNDSIFYNALTMICYVMHYEISICGENGRAIVTFQFFILIRQHFECVV